MRVLTSLVSIFVIALMVSGLSLLLGTQDAQANDKMTICHVPPTPNQTVPFATGRVIEIDVDSCVDHCTDHGGDHVIGDTSCAAQLDEKTCIVNSLQQGLFCSVERCIAICENVPTCEGFCGGGTPFGCFCDELCFGFGDCCDDVCDFCSELGGCSPG